MDLTADPCIDFEQFACGGWKEQTQIPDDKGRYGRFDELQDSLNAKLRSKVNSDLIGSFFSMQIYCYCLALLDDSSTIYGAKSKNLARIMYQKCMNFCKWFLRTS